jgi:hypothetical protein
MNQTTPAGSDDLGEEMMGRMIAEAGDPAVEPRSEHVSELRSLVLSRIPPARRTVLWKRPMVLGSGVAAALVAAALLLVMSRPANAWPEVAQALQGKPWVHTRSVGPDGKDFGEVWFSPKLRVSAARHGSEIEYHDRGLRIVTKFMRDEGVIYRLPENPDLASQSLDFFTQLLDPKGPTKSPLPGMDVIAQSRHDVVEDGRSWVDLEFTLRVVGADREQRIRIRVDSKTKLPHSMAVHSKEGPEGTMLFDYPERGPADVYELGAPRTAKIVDRVPSDDIERIGAGLKIGRVRFDDYRAIMDMGDGSNVKRVWRRGSKWRAETLIGDMKRWPAFPRNADSAWWKAHQGDFKVIVQAVCDGERVYYYQAEGNVFDPNAKQPPKLKLSMTQAINPSDDPFMPWPHLFVEHLSHPMVWPPTPEREFILDAKPGDGPGNTIRLRVRNTRSTDPAHSDFWKLWINPAQGYISLRTESLVFESQNPPKVAYVDTMTMEDLRQSPSGFWYPGKVRRVSSNFKDPQPANFDPLQVWTYHLEFDVPMPDELFRPL